MAWQAKPRTPRWRTPPPAPPPVIQVRGRAARRALAAHYAAQGAVPPPEKVPSLHRYRHMALPAAWGLAVVLASLGLHLAGVAVAPVTVAAACCAAAVLLMSRHLSRYARRASAAVAVLTAFWLPVMSRLGLRPWLAFFLACWVAVAFTQAHHYRIRDGEPGPGPSADEERWGLLAGHKKWDATLGRPEQIPGGVRYPLRTDGIQTHLGHIASDPLAVAAAFRRPVTDAYVEPATHGDPSAGYLTILQHGTLQRSRTWNGQGVTGDGFAVVGRFADGADARIRLFAPMDGTRHGLISGTTGAGKSSLLDLFVRILLTSGFIVPVILDPQEGQSLPDWSDRVPYAAGVDECMEMLELIHQAMYARSGRLAQMTWDDGGHQRKMSFFDHVLTGWPVVVVLFDEAHMALTGGNGREDAKRAQKAVSLVKDIGKLGRKTGVALWLVTQVPSMEELGSTVLRAMLRGGNVICFRTADSGQSHSMLGIPADPSLIPQYFPDGSYTYGLGYVLGPDRRQAIARTDMPSREHLGLGYQLPALEPEFARILARFGAPQPAASEQAPVLAAVDDSPAPGGRTAADAVLAVLKGAMTRGELIKAAQDVSVEWGRSRQFETRSITTALAKLVDDGRVSHPEDRGPYYPVRPSLSLIGEP